jgi:hypothetical protein
MRRAFVWAWGRVRSEGRGEGEGLLVADWEGMG